MSAGILKALNSRLNNSGNEVSFLITLVPREIIDVNRWFGFFSETSSLGYFSVIDRMVFFIESRVFLIMASNSGLMAVTLSFP